MSEAQLSDLPESKDAPRTRVRVLIYGLFGLVLLVLFAEVISGPIEIVLTLVVGWVSFLRRTWPKLHWNWDLIGMALVCITFILAGTHWFANWLSRAIQVSRSTQAGWCWPWKWTWCGLSLVVLGFLVGMSVGGVVHQAGWIASSPEPMLELKGFSTDRINMQQLDEALQSAIDESNGNIQRIRLQTQRKGSEFQSRFGERGSLLESCHVLLILAADGGCNGAIIFPRNTKSRERYGGWYLLGKERGPKPNSKITELIRQHGTNLISL